MVEWGSPDEETVRLRPPVDPWPDVQDGHTREVPVVSLDRRRQIYGRVYELFTTRPDLDGAHPYAGQTTTTIHRRIHGPGGHMSAESVAIDPWKARIKPGRAGYRCLKTIYATDDPGADQVRLDMAEAFAIDHLKTTYNKQRPIRTPGVEMPRRLPAREPAAVKRPRRRLPLRVWAFLVLVTLFTFLAARVVLLMQLPWPAAPWVVSPIIGVGLAWRVLWSVHASARKLTRRTRRR